MASSKEYLDFIMDQLSSLSGVSYKAMMGEYLLYLNRVLFGGLYDNRFLVKKTKSLESYKLPTAIPYDGAKEMYEIDIEDEKAKEIILKAYSDLKK